jgi:hypothetical protein
MGAYERVFALLLTRVPAERAHTLGFALIRLAGALPGCARCCGGCWSRAIPRCA